MLMAPTACDDDLGHQNNKGEHIVFNPVLTDTWNGAMSVDESSPTTHCTSVRELSGGDSKMYLHTVVAENPAEKKTMTSRGALINDKPAFYKNFSLSGVCYTGEYDEAEVTPNYAFDRCYSTETGLKADDGMPLLWPSGGKVRFFAFAPTREDFHKTTGIEMLMSRKDDNGSPKLIYTVPKEVEKQIDLMTVSADVTTMASTVDLKFTHALTAVQIKCGDGMLAFTVTGVSICNIHGTGTTVIGSNEWTDLKGPETYSIEKDITLSAKDDATDKLHVDKGTPITGTDSDNLTFLLLPQTLPDGAEMVITLKNNEKHDDKIELKASLKGEKWDAGKIVSYSVSPNDIKVSPKLTLDKKGATSADEEGDIMPYSGVWYDATYTATAEITKPGSWQTGLTIPKDKIKFQYKFEGESDWQDCPDSPTEEDKGFLSIKLPEDYVFNTIQQKFTKTDEVGSKGSPEPINKGYNETANCYLVDQAGYYSLPLVYGNGETGGGHYNGLTYYPNHDNEHMIPADLTNSNNDAVLVWQDSPDLIDPASVHIDNGNIVFRIRKQTLAEGNAVVAVRNSSKTILWSWHIWVTPYKSNFYSDVVSFTTETGHTYGFAPYNLGWCDPHVAQPSRKFELQALIDMSAYGINDTKTVQIPGEFTLMEFKASDGGDNTYYQWGRKDPMLGGIYSTTTPTYKYRKPSNKPPKPEYDSDEFTMENKQIFNQYNQDGFDYSFCKNPGDLADDSHEASRGVTIGYAIQHPYMFITNSYENANPRDEDKGNPDAFNYRNHWHIPYKDLPVSYLNDGTHILFNAWNATATDAGVQYSSSPTDEQKTLNAMAVTKSVYDPCPPGFKMPPIDALYSIYTEKTDVSYQGNKWTMNIGGKSITFPLTGVRNYALRSTEWTSVEPLTEATDGSSFNYTSFYKTSMPAFKMLTFMSSATIIKKESYNAYQVYIFCLDRNDRSYEPTPDTPNYKMYITASSNSYGLSVRPVTSDSE